MCALVVLLHPSEQVAALFCLPVGAIISAWLWRQRGKMVERGEPAATPALAGSFVDPDGRTH